jgi:hypothetical protein
VGTETVDYKTAFVATGLSPIGDRPVADSNL